MPETIELLSSSPIPGTPVRPPSTQSIVDNITLLSSSSPLVSPGELISNAAKARGPTRSSFFETTPTRTSSFTTASQLLREEQEKEKEKEDENKKDEENKAPTAKKAKATTSTTKKTKKGSGKDDTLKATKITGKVTKPRSRASSPKTKKDKLDAPADIFDIPVSSQPEPPNEEENKDASKSKEQKEDEMEETVAPQKKPRAKKATAAKPKAPKKPRKPLKKADITTLGMYEVPLPTSSPLAVELPKLYGAPDAATEGDDAKKFATPPDSPSRRQRKRSWTPVEDTEKPPAPDVVDLLGDTPEKPKFDKLVDSFKHAPEQNGNAPGQRETAPEPLMKKRCLELVGIPSNQSYARPRKSLGKDDEDEDDDEPSAAPKGKKTKGKKKITTITELATRQFRKEVDDDGETEGSSLYGFFATQLDKRDGDGDEGPMEVALPKRGRKAAAPKKKPTAKSRKSKQSEPKVALLDPESAQKAAQEQHLIFGTSSQLVQSQSPEGGWNLEIKNGVTVGKEGENTRRKAWELSDSEEDDDGDEPMGTQTMTLQMNVAREEDNQPVYKRRFATAKKGLWNAAGGLDGDDDVEVIDMIDSPAKPSAFKFATVPEKNQTSSKETSKTTGAEKQGTTSGVIDAYQKPLKDLAPNVPLSTKSSAPSSQRTSTDPKAQPASKAKSKSKKNNEPDLPTEADRPNFDGFTQLQLATQLAKYGYKPIKSRNTMVKILNACWDGIIQRANLERERLKNAGESDEVNSAQEPLEDIEHDEEEGIRPPSSQPAATQKKKGRSRKTSEQPEDILTEETTKKTSKGRGKAKDKDAPAVVGSAADPNALQDEEITQIITKAVTSQKPGTQLNAPSFHQRILMYESIVLEDLTDWLVAEGLPNIGEDADRVLGTNKRSKYERISAVHRWCVKGSIVWVRKAWQDGENRWK